MYYNDYIMREIENLSRFVKAVFQRESSFEMVDEQGRISETGLLYYDLKSLISENKLNEAEDLLFEKLEQNPDEEYLQIAIEFYKNLQNLSDEVLESASFPRQEIVQGLETVKRMLLERQSAQSADE